MKFPLKEKMVKLTNESSYARFVLETCYSQMLPEFIFANSLENSRKNWSLEKYLECYILYVKRVLDFLLIPVSLTLFFQCVYVLLIWYLTFYNISGSLCFSWIKYLFLMFYVHLSHLLDSVFQIICISFWMDGWVHGWLGE